MRIIMAVLWLSVAWAELPPKGITVSQWVREEYFAAYLGNDMASFARAEAKAREIWMADDNPEARAWWASGKFYLSARAYQAGDIEKGALLFDEARGQANRALGKKDSAAVAVLAASYILFADRFPANQQEALNREGRNLFALLRKEQDAVLDQMPVHFKGEVLAGQAQAAMRLGLQAEATKYLNEIVAKLPNTHYAQTAEQWLANPASAAKGKIVCQSCHEPNRLENRLKALAKTP